MVGAPFEPTQSLPFGIGAIIAGRYEVRGHHVVGFVAWSISGDGRLVG